jgi:hypothetical protein
MDTQTVPQLLPNGVYDDVSLYTTLGVSAQVLADARRSGELRFARKERRVIYLGKWVERWLRLGSTPPPNERRRLRQLEQEDVIN